MIWPTTVPQMRWEMMGAWAPGIGLRMLMVIWPIQKTSKSYRKLLMFYWCSHYTKQLIFCCVCFLFPWDALEKWTICPKKCVTYLTIICTKKCKIPMNQLGTLNDHPQKLKPPGAAWHFLADWSPCQPGHHLSPGEKFGEVLFVGAERKLGWSHFHRSIVNFL